MVEKKKNGIFFEILLKILKFLPLMIIVACACGMIAFILCSHFVNKEYVSTGSFRALSKNHSVINDQAESLIKNNYDFYARVAGNYNLKTDSKISAAYVKKCLYISSNDSAVKIIVSDSDPVIAFDILSSVRESLDVHFEIFNAQIELDNVYWDMQPSTHFSMNKMYIYILASAAIGFLIVFITAIAKGAVRGKIASVREFQRNYRSDFCIVLPYVNYPVGINQEIDSEKTEENDD